MADKVILEDADIELGVLAGLLGFPELMAEFAPVIPATWFAFALHRHLYAAALSVHEQGGEISASALMASLPVQVDGMRRSEIVGGIFDRAASPDMARGLVPLLKDRWARRVLKNTGDEMRRRAENYESSPFDASADAVHELDAVNAAKAQRGAVSLAAAARELVEALKAPERLRGWTTGVRALDGKLNGFVPQQFYVLAARPGMGKSAVACSLMRRTAEAGGGVMFFSKEMPEREVAARCVSDAFNHVHSPAYGDILRGFVSEADIAAVAEQAEAFSRLPILVDASPALSVSELHARARKAAKLFEARGFPLALIVVDHMGLVAPTGNYRGNKVAETGEVSNGLRVMAKDMDSTVLGLSQLSREVEARDDKRPRLSDLRWSGELEQDAHNVVFLYREAYYLAHDPKAEPGQLQAAQFKLEAQIAKNRNGPTGDVELWCSIRHSSVRDAELSHYG